MATEYMIANNGRPLNGDNFNAWKIRMTSVLTALGLSEYVTTNRNINTLSDAEKQQNAIARSILLNNIEDKLYPMITLSDSTYELMENLKNIYEKDQNVTLQDWMNKLKQLKVKNHYDLLNTINKMMVIFKQMDNTGVPLTEPEKIDYMLGCMPNQLKIIFISGNTSTAKELFDDIKLKYKLLYHVGNNDSRNNINNREQVDRMDIDLINNIINTNNNKNKNKIYCHICKKKNHNTDECYFNTKNKNNNKKKNNYKNQNYNNNHHNKNIRRNNHFNYINKNDKDKDIIYSDSDEEYFNNRNNNVLYINNINYENDNSNSEITSWIYDTGASEHITNNKNILTNFKEKQITMKCANDTTCKFLGYGTYTGKINNYNIKLNKVYYSKDISKNLLSGIKLAQSNINCEVNNYYNKPQLTLTHNNKIILKTYVNKHNNFNIKTKNIIIDTNKKLFNLNSQENYKKIWHNRLGHYYNENLDKYLKYHNINKNECVECQISKLNRNPHNGNTPKASNINEIIYSDIMGPVNESINKYKYIITFIDDYSRKAWIYPLKSKADAGNIIINFLRFINNQHPNNKIKIFKSDNAKEYNNKKIKNFCKRNGISKEFSAPYNPQNNGIAERFNRTVTACTKTMLHWARLSLNFWEYAIKHATYIYNLVPHKSINNYIPNEIYYNKKVNLKYLKTFGCIAYYKNFNQNKEKFEINSKKGVYLGYDNNTYSYIIMDYYDHSIHYTREAVFIEEKPGNLQIDPGCGCGNIIINKVVVPSGATVSNNDKISEGEEFDSSVYPTSIIPDDHSEHQEFESASSQISAENNIQENFNNSSSNNNNNINIPNSQQLNLINYNKIKRPLSPQEEIHKNKFRAIDYDKNIHTINTSENNNNNYTNNFSNNNCLNDTNKNSNNVQYKKVDIILNQDGLYVPKIYVVNTEVPICYNHIKYRDDKKQWLIAIQKELKNLYDNHVMTFVKTIPKNANLISTQWVFAIKRNKFNEIIKFKARLVARGDLQIYGLDYTIVYSPTLDIICIRIIIFYASKFKWNTYQLDIQAAYLNAPLDQDVYVKIPQGDKNFGKGYWKLNKSLYGLKQSGRNWNATITEFLLSIGFKQCKNEPCLFYYINERNEVSCIIGLYVDDMIITGFNYDLLYFIQKIKNKFSISNCQIINYILGISIEKDNNFNYTISQKAYIENLLRRYNIINTKKCNTPCTGENLISKNTNPFDKTTYKSAIGSLIHLAKCTRPDISFAVNYAARFCENPTVSDWNKILNIFKYLNNTINYKITYNANGNFLAYSDADFGGDRQDRKSTSGMLICIGNNPIFWASKKQTTVALSTTEAEFISAATCSRKILWIQNLIKEIFNKKLKMTLYLDNLSCKKILENGQFNNNMKHIDIQEHFIFDLVKNNKIKLEYIETENMLADTLTKNVNGPKMTKFTNLIFTK